MHNFKEDLKELFLEGILVGEKEDPDSFLKRVHKLKKLPVNKFKNPVFGVETVYVTVEKKKAFIPWFAAYTKFEYEDGIVIPKIEISPFAPKETLDHELVHAIKAPHKDSIFEEFLAFETSEGLRKLLGPLFFDPWEANILAITILLGFFVPFLYIAALGLSLFFAFRLYRTRRLFNKALEEISRVFNAKNPLPYALLLSEREMKLFGWNQGELALKVMETEDPLRYRQISALDAIKVLVPHSKNGS